MELTPYNLIGMAAGGFFVGFFKSTFSGAIGATLVPVMILFWPTQFVLGLIAVHMVTADWALIRLFWKKWEWRYVILVMPGYFIGIVLGAMLLVRLPDFWIRKSIGMTCLIFGGLQAFGELRGDLPVLRIGRAGGVGLGVVGGIFSSLTHAGGIVMNLFLLSQKVPKLTLVATVLLLWIWVNPLKLASFWVGGLVDLTLFLGCAAMVPLTFTGGWIGKKVLDFIPQRGFNLTILALSGLTAARLLWE